MNVLSLFDGMSCGRIALGKADIKVDNYYSAEIDKYAISIADKNYPQDSDKRLGDVTKWQEWDINWASIDLVTGGFPCQAWSLAGKGLGDKDERGMLFWTMLNIMKKVLYHNSKAKFLMENVRMKKEFEDYITTHTEEALGVVYKHLINSALVSAQNRKRFYWTNISNIEQPEDKSIVLKDILEGGYVDRDKSHCLDANYFKGGNLKSYFEKHRRQLVFSEDALCHHREPEILYNEKEYRKLTPLECERLQTVPAGYTEGVSNTQRYKMLGNGWTVDVIAHIFKGLK